MVTLVAASGIKSMDLYARKLAENLDVPKVYSDCYQRVAKLFNTPLFSQAAMKAIWEDWRFIRMLNRLGSIVHLPNHHLGRYGLFLKVPYIITVHDLIRYFDLKGYGPFIHRPNLRDRLYLSLDYKGVKRATRIIAVSQYTKRDLMHHLGIPEEQISVVYEGVDDSLFRPSPYPAGFDQPYILFIGSEQPRKNLPTLLRAFAKLKEERQFNDLKLVKVGKAGGAEADFRGRTMEVINSLHLAEEVIFTGFVPEEELPGYYSGAGCFVLPSVYEGFGLPVMEAMACGCPVIISNRSSLPEIAGGAAIEVDPCDVEGLAAALRGVLTDQALRKNLIDAGRQQAARFSWRKAAEQTLKVYREVEEHISHRQH